MDEMYAQINKMNRNEGNLIDFFIPVFGIVRASYSESPIDIYLYFFLYLQKLSQIVWDCLILLFIIFVLSTFCLLTRCVMKLIFNKMYLYQQNDITNYGLFLNHCIFTLFYFTAKHIFKWIFYFSCAVIIVLPIW